MANRYSTGQVISFIGMSMAFSIIILNILLPYKFQDGIRTYAIVCGLFVLIGLVFAIISPKHRKIFIFINGSAKIKVLYALYFLFALFSVCFILYRTHYVAPKKARALLEEFERTHR